MPKQKNTASKIDSKSKMPMKVMKGSKKTGPAKGGIKHTTASQMSVDGATRK